GSGQASVKPDRADDRDVDRGKDVGRRAKDDQRSQDQDDERDDHEGVRPAQREADDPHRRILFSKQYASTRRSVSPPRRRTPSAVARGKTLPEGSVTVAFRAQTIDQFSKPGLGTDPLEQGISLEEHVAREAVARRLAKPIERGLAVSEKRVRASDVVLRVVIVAESPSVLDRLIDLSVSFRSVPGKCGQDGANGKEKDLALGTSFGRRDRTSRLLALTQTDQRVSELILCPGPGARAIGVVLRDLDR